MAPYHSAYAVLLGFPFYVLCDLLLRCVSRRLGKWIASPSKEQGKA